MHIARSKQMRDVQVRIADLGMGPGRRKTAYGGGTSDKGWKKVYDGLSHL